MDLLEEVGLLLLDRRGEALVLGLVDGVLDELSLGLYVRLGLLLVGAGLSFVLAPERSAELGVVAPAVVEVGGVRCLGCVLVLG